uniref:glutaminase n=1 Tax=Echeneis naucrates TaxID=173247 RepID=A0A665VSB6_ECHNA
CFSQTGPVVVVFSGLLCVTGCCCRFCGLVDSLLCVVCRCVTGFVSLILKALQGRFVIPDFSTFTEQTQKLFSRCRQLSSDQVSHFLSQTAPGSGQRTWGVSICTVDGQRLSLGDWAGSQVLGEVSWPLVYGVAVDLLGSDLVHRYVGNQSPSLMSSDFVTNIQSAGIPHSPLTETGAIVTTSLLQVTPSLCDSEATPPVSLATCHRSDVTDQLTDMSEGQRSRLASAVVSHHTLVLQCFPEKVDVSAALDLMLQCSSTEITCESGAVMAASLANGGLCPLSGDQVMSPAATRSLLSMMQVAGMKDYSSVFHYKTSIPAASSSSGFLFAVVPGVLGLMAFSPELDAYGNPWRAVHFCQVTTSFCLCLSGHQIINVLLAAFKGDVQSLRRYFLSGVDVNVVDYDGRTALHVAAAEGHTEVIRFLLENTRANPALKDRWGSSALQEAQRHRKDSAVQLLQGHVCPPGHTV